jgi:tetratricopeptide (TPR) repeat protein
MASLPFERRLFKLSPINREYFLKTFFEREEEIKDIFSHINYNLVHLESGANKKNFLLKGPRGIGKSSIFLRVKLHLQNEKRHLLKRIIPIFFNEWEDMNTTKKLIHRIYQIVLDNPDGFIQLSQPESWKTGYRELRPGHSSGSDPFLLLKDNIKSENRKLVLFIENFDTLVFRLLRMMGGLKTGKKDNKKSEKKEYKKVERSISQKLFQKIIADPDIVLICSAVEKPDTIHEYGEETFKMIDLKPLKNLYGLLGRRIRCDNNLFPRTQIERLRNKTRAFEFLTEGNTRFMIQFYENVVRDGIQNMKYHLNTILDTNSPLFELILERSVDFKSREILNLMTQSSGNMTIKELARETGSSENTIRTLLSRLKDKNFVSKIDEKRHQSDIYILKRRMLFLWYHTCMLQNIDQLYHFYIHFIDLYFDPTVLKETKDPFIYPFKLENEDDFITDSTDIKPYLESGKFFPDCADKKVIDRMPVPEIESLIYRVVRAQQDDSILQQKITEADELKIDNQMAEAANLYRIVARGYLILTEEFKKPFYKKAKENILEAAEIYRKLHSNPLERVYSMMMVVEMLSRHEPELKDQIIDFTRAIIQQISKEEKEDDFIPYLGYAYKYRGFAESNIIPEKKLKMFHEAKEYFEKNQDEMKQVIIVLVNMGLVHLESKNYNDALNHFEVALELSQKHEVPDYLGPIIFFIFEIYKISEKFSVGLAKSDEILKWLGGRDYKGVDRKRIFNYMAFFLYKNDGIEEAEEYLLKIYRYGTNDNDLDTTLISLLDLNVLYRKLNKLDKIEKMEKEILKIIEKTTDFPAPILHKIAQLFRQSGNHDKEKMISEQLYQHYEKSGEIKKQLSLLVNIGIASQKSGDFKAAEENFRKAIKSSNTKKFKYKEISDAASFNLALLLEKKESFDEFLHILEALKNANSLFPGYNVQKRLFFEYLRRAKNCFKMEDIENAVIFVRKSLNNITDLPIEDFISGFYFFFILPLIDQYGKKISPFFSDLNLQLLTFYLKKDKGEFIEIIKFISDIAAGEEFNKVTRDLPLMKREVLWLIKQSLENSSSPQQRKYDSQDTAAVEMETGKLAQIASLIMDATTGSLQKAGTVMETVLIDRLDSTHTCFFYFWEIILLCLKQSTEKMKSSLTQLLRFIEGLPPDFLMETVQPGLDKWGEISKEKLKPKEHRFLTDLGKVMQNKAPIIPFTRRFVEYIEKDACEELSNKPGDSLKSILRRMVSEKNIAVEQVVTISGSRLFFEQLLYTLKNEFPEFTEKEKFTVIVFLGDILEKLPESYKWLVLDFCSTRLSGLEDKLQKYLITSLVKSLAAKRDSSRFMDETAAVLRVAKNMLDTQLKEQIEKELLNTNY